MKLKLSLHVINPFQADVFFLYPLQKTRDFLTFSGGVEREHWPEMVLKSYGTNIPDH